MTSPTHTQSSLQVTSERCTHSSSQATSDHERDEPLKLSFCVPVFNLEPYLDECLSSLTSQSYPNIEIICVDDGSTDQSPAKLRDWAARDKRIHIITQHNTGVSAARNVAMAHATGDYLTFVDGDDYLDTHMAALTLEAARTTDADIVVYGGRAFPETRWITDTFGPRDAALSGNGADFILVERGCIPSACNKLYKRSLIVHHDIRFNEQLRLGEDLNFQFKVFPYAMRVTFLSARLYHYRYRREGSALNQNYATRLAQLTQHIEVFDLTAQEWKNRGILAGRASTFLGGIAFLFNDFDSLDPQEKLTVGRAFKAAFDRSFTRNDLRARMEIKMRLRYQLLLDLATCNGTPQTIARLVRSWQRKLKLLGLYHAIRYH